VTSAARDAATEFARLLDQAIRSPAGTTREYTNVDIAGLCGGIGQSRPGAWRRPGSGQHMTAFRLLQLPEPVFDALIELLIAARSEARGDLPPRTIAATIGSMGALAGRLAIALVTGDGEPRGTREIVAGLLAVLADARRCLAHLVAGSEP
jgi:hypothetical protein